MSSLLPIFITVCWTACVAGVAYYAATVAREITYVTLADGRKEARALPLVFKLLLPFVHNLDSFTRRKAFDRQRKLADEMLVSAGMEGLLTGNDFIALKYLMPIACGTVFSLLFLLMGHLMPESFFGENKLLLIIMSFAIAYIYPVRWLNKTLKARHLSIMRALPFVLDLLTLSVEAGMDFMSALQRNCERRKLDPLNEELIRMTREIQVGTPRRVALKNMAERVKQPDLRSVAYSLIQADELGVSIGQILRIQSEQLRSRRFERAEKLANEAPVKMLGPLMLCIFPAVFIVLLAPILTQAMQNAF